MMNQAARKDHVESFLSERQVLAISQGHDSVSLFRMPDHFGGEIQSANKAALDFGQYACAAAVIENPSLRGQKGEHFVYPPFVIEARIRSLISQFFIGIGDMILDFEFFLAFVVFGEGGHTTSLLSSMNQADLVGEQSDR